MSKETTKQVLGILDVMKIQIDALEDLVKQEPPVDLNGDIEMLKMASDYLWLVRDNYADYLKLNEGADQ